MKCSLVMLSAMSREWIASDVWKLAYYHAVDDAVKMGIPDAEKVLAKIMLAITGERSKNPFMQQFMG
jgi:hypothetical protein